MTEAIKEKLAEIAALLVTLGNMISGMLGETQAEEPKTVEEKAEEPKTVETKKEYKLEDVRKVLAEKSGAGFTDQIRELLMKHGGSRLSEVPKEEYAAIMEEVKEIGCSQ